MSQQKDAAIYNRLKKEYKRVTKHTLNSEKILKELVHSVSRTGSLLDRKDGFVQFYDKVIDIENNCLYIVDDKINEEDQ